jgi:putative ABC transport system permease protein
MLSQLKILASRIRGWLSVRRVDEEFEQELTEHLAMLTAENVRRGMTPEEARRAARLRLGGSTQLHEVNRELRGLPLLETLFHDIQHALRTLRKNPGFSLVCILTLALGIGANSAIFSVVSAVLLRPLPYPNQERLVRIEETHLEWTNANSTYANFLDVQHRTKTVENISAYRPWLFNLTGEGEPEQIEGALVSGDFFAALGSKPLLGRIIRPEDDQPGGDNHVAVLSYALWQARFGSDRKVIGKMVRINAEDFLVAGVMRRGFDYPEQSEIWCPLVPGGELHANRRAHLLTVIGDVRREASLGSTQGELSVIGGEIEKENPGVDPDMTLRAVSLKKSIVKPVQPALLILIFAVGLLLMIACANLANLLLARAATRQKEFAIRTALGAGRLRLARQLLTESVIVALVGAALGLGVAWRGLALIMTLGGTDIPRLGEMTLDWRVLAFTVGVSLLTGMLFGLAPAISGTRIDLNTSLKEGASQSTGACRHRSSTTLVVAQFALAVVLLAGAGLLGNSFLRVLRVNPGFNADHVITLNLFLSPVKYPERDPKGAVTLREMLEHVRAIPGVHSAGLVNALPITGGPSTDFLIEGRPIPPANSQPDADIRVADEHYFQTMGIPLLAGRDFTVDDRAGSAKVMLINETMARQFWPQENPLGKHVTMEDWGTPLTGEIVGIVGDVKTNGLDAAVGPMIYWPYFQFTLIFNTIVVRSDADPVQLVPALKGAIWSVDKDQSISKIETMGEILFESLAQRRLYLVLLGVFSMAALFLATLGIYGMVSYSVSQRAHEIGIRMAVGAERKDVLKLVLGEGGKIALLGIGIGVATALALTRLMSSLLFGVSATDPETFLYVAILLALIAMAACYIPARRATRVDPMVALRHE